MRDWRDWHLPLARGDVVLSDGLADMRRVGAGQRDIPLIVQLVENPRFDIPGLDIFHGATDLDAHDSIHLLLGRGLLPKDEAFVIGFTMGATGKVTTAEERLFTLISRHLYPAAYRLGDEEVRVFRDAVRLGFVTGCRSLHDLPWPSLADRRLSALRAELGVDEPLLAAYYALEARRFPDAPESRRLLV